MSARATQAQEELTYAGYYSTSMFPPVELLYVTGTEKDAVASALQSMWSTTLGVNVMLRGVTQAEYNARMEAGNYELALQRSPRSTTTRWASSTAGAARMSRT